ncbi:tetratricopeptide repeat protein [Lichenibacterium ramalinae]|uniref:protein O-GlcNAc transferase n=1 Tax=Lichenibacterium ramalinae TaxID=2316527 RepID=A0A4Q2RF74_9HYPH|nr:tetratricopeptide repeat protein [Lichenibacterium ramalinae]RYB05951.1 hypothetical protein D3272_07075 [Lichenibacterium ramalinae]
MLDAGPRGPAFPFSGPKREDASLGQDRFGRIPGDRSDVEGEDAMNRADRRREARPHRTSLGPSPVADGAYRAGSFAASRGDLAEARRHYEGCLAIDPSHVESRHDLAVVMLRCGAPVAAVEQFEQVLARQPRHAGAWMNLSLAHCELEDADAAVTAATRAVEVAPRAGAAQAAMGHALALRGDLAAAEAAYRRSLDLDGGATSVIARLADILRRLGRPAESVAAWERCLALAPRDLASHAERLLGLEGTSELRTKARAAFADLAAADQPGLRDLSVGWSGKDRAGDAVALLDVVVAERPDIADVRVLRASLLHGLGRMNDALADLKHALSLDPANPDVLFSVGRFFECFDQADAAAPFYLEAIERRPDFAEAYVSLAAVRLVAGDVASNIALLRHAMMLAPDRCHLAADLCWGRLFACDWAGLEQEFKEALERHVSAGQSFPPFTLFAFGLAGDALALWTRAWAELKIGPARTPLARYAPRPDERERIRVGYLSADYKDHATMLLVTEMFEMHDRTRFETFGYNIGALDESASCRRAIRSLDHFVDLFALKDGDAAKRIAQDGIDILIDLKGYTKDNRCGILGYRPAPIQVNYLGYPGSMGTPVIDYIVADAVVIPDEHRRFYDEAVVHLPHSYQPNDRHRASADPCTKRGDHGLPDGAFVFCCFNSSYKITPVVFDIWMRALRDVPGAVIWLLAVNGQIEDNLRKEAASRGIDPARLVFAPRVAFEAHIGRMALADLFLDTLPVNAHTTASEALWAGLPVLTCLGPHFVGRVAGSLLKAIGLPELVTTSLADYEREALALARDPARLGALRSRLAENRSTAPLFDTPRYVRGYEAALERMVAMREAGHPPATFAVSDLTL